jgi:acetyltransferase-like isoleucine patch superfamily enzyme
MRPFSPFKLHRYPSYASALYWRVHEAWLLRRLRRAGITIGEPVSFLGSPIVSLAAGATISIGRNCLICSQSDKTALGVNHACVFRTIRPGAVLSIGDGVRMSGTTLCAAVRVEIGNRVVIGSNATIIDTDFHALDPEVRSSERDGDSAVCEPVRVEDDVFIGMQAMILKGVTVGHGSVVAAGAVVTKSCPPWSIIGGNPAKIIGQVDAPR